MVQVVHSVRFVKVFGLKKQGELKHATARAMKCLLKRGCELIDSSDGDRGRPPKRARMCDLKRVYNDLE